MGLIGHIQKEMTMNEDDEMFTVEFDEEFMEEFGIEEGPMTREELDEKLEAIILHQVRNDPMTALDFIQGYIEACLKVEQIAQANTKTCLKICDVLKSQLESLTFVGPRH